MTNSYVSSHNFTFWVFSECFTLSWHFSSILNEGNVTILDSFYQSIGFIVVTCPQVSKLIILHEEGEDGNAMPDLEKPVLAVSTAVNNLVRVGHDTIASSQVNKNETQSYKRNSVLKKNKFVLNSLMMERQFRLNYVGILMY